MQKKAKSVKNSFGSFQESEVYEELTYRDLDREVRKLLELGSIGRLTYEF